MKVRKGALLLLVMNKKKGIWIGMICPQSP